MAPRHVTEFVQQLTPMAVEIGDRYGIDPALIITQAAIESGWGQEVSGNNYFGVKSHGQPGGQTILTHEEIGGQKVPVYDSFRVYDSLANSMEDYARFLSTNPRYGDVFKSRDLDEQVKAIAESGYATDSNYPGLLRDVSRMVKREMGPMPPAQIPNVVASQLDTQRPIPPLPQPRPQRMVQGTGQAPTSAASRAVPTMSATPRLAPAQDGVFAYTPPDMQPAQITPGMGSLTPDFFRPKPQVRLPELPPSNLASSRVVNTSIERANAAVDPGLQAALARRVAQPGMVETSMARAANAVDPALQRALEARNSVGVGLPPATRSVPSVPVRVSQPGPMNNIGAMPSFGDFQSQFGMGVPGPAFGPKDQARLTPGVYPMAPGGPAVASALSVTPPLPRPRPLRTLANVAMPTPMGQRPTLPAPMQSPLRVTVQGANSYNAPQPQYVSTTGQALTPRQTVRYNPDTNTFAPVTLYEPQRQERRPSLPPGPAQSLV